MAPVADRLAVGDVEPKLGIFRPGIDVMGVKLLRRFAVRTSVTIAFKDGDSPSSICPGTPRLAELAGVVSFPHRVVLAAMRKARALCRAIGRAPIRRGRENLPALRTRPSLCANVPASFRAVARLRFARPTLVADAAFLTGERDAFPASVAASECAARRFPAPAGAWVFRHFGVANRNAARPAVAPPRRFRSCMAPGAGRIAWRHAHTHSSTGGRHA